jgi:putative transposase
MTDFGPNDGRSCSYVYYDSPEVSGSSVIGFLKGKSAIAVARQLCGKERNFTGEHLWARGYAVSTVGFELEQVRQCIRDQEEADGSGGEFKI